jgi:hypothetical protein
MLSEEMKGPFCQSCGMPLQKPADFGADEAGYRVNDYCRYCFVDGAFVDPGMSMQAMLEKCVGVMARQGAMPEAQARALMAEVLPRLKRWRSASTPS